MTTPHPRELLSAYLDDEVTVEERARVEAWLETSPEGREELRDLDELGGILRSALAVPGEPINLLADVRSAISSPPESTPVRPAVSTSPAQPRERRGAGWMAAVSIATSVAAVVVTAVLLAPPDGSDKREMVAWNRNVEMDGIEEFAGTTPPGGFGERAEEVSDEFERVAEAENSARPSPSFAGAPRAAVADEYADRAKGRMLYLDGRELAARRNFVVPRGSIPDDVEAGDVIPLYESNEDRVAVVRVTVVDVRRALGEVQLLLQKNDVTPLSPEPKVDSEAMATIEKLGRDGGTYAVYVTASPDQLNAALESLRANKEVVGLAGPRDLVALQDKRMREPVEPQVAASAPAPGVPQPEGGEALADALPVRPGGKKGAGDRASGTQPEADKNAHSSSYQLLGPVALADRQNRTRLSVDSATIELARTRDSADAKREDAPAEEAGGEGSSEPADEARDAKVRVLLLLQRRPR